jgi:hypothetical protein
MIIPKLQWLITWQAKKTGPTSSARNVYEAPGEVPTRTAPVVLQSPEGCTNTLCVPAHEKVIASPTDAARGGSGPPPSGTRQTSGPTVRLAAEARVVAAAAIAARRSRERRALILYDGRVTSSVK